MFLLTSGRFFSLSGWSFNFSLSDLHVFSSHLRQIICHRDSGLLRLKSTKTLHQYEAIYYVAEYSKQCIIHHSYFYHVISTLLLHLPLPYSPSLLPPPLSTLCSTPSISFLHNILLIERISLILLDILSKYVWMRHTRKNMQKGPNGCILCTTLSKKSHYYPSSWDGSLPSHLLVIQPIILLIRGTYVNILCSSSFNCGFLQSFSVSSSFSK